jgi:transcription initiation factor TFIIH subunit 2
MADSDGEFQADDASDDEYTAPPGTSVDTRGRSGANRKGGRKNAKAAWEDIQRSWDAVVEGTDGTLAGAIEGLAEAEKRARLMKDTTPLQRGIIRHLVLVLDMSFAMLEKDLLPSRYELSMAYASEFVREYFEQNPISQLAVVGMRDGVAVRVSDMSGNPADHLEKLQEWVKQEPQGNPSLQNALEMCRGALLYVVFHKVLARHSHTNTYTAIHRPTEPAKS